MHIITVTAKNLSLDWKIELDKHTTHQLLACRMFNSLFSA